MKKIVFVVFLIICTISVSCVFHKVGGVSVYGISYDAVISSSVAIISTSSECLEFYDLNSVTNPALISTLDLDGRAWKLQIDGTRCYSVIDYQTVVMVDFSDVQNPTILGEFSYITEDIIQFAAHGDLVYLCTANFLYIVSVADPSAPLMMSLLQLNGPHNQTSGLYYHNGFLYFPTLSGVMVFDVTNPHMPEHVTNMGTNRAYSMYLADNVAYVGDNQGFHLYDVSDIQNIQLIYEHLDTTVYSIFMQDSRLFTMISPQHSPDHLIRCWDIHDLNDVSLIGTYSGAEVIGTNGDLIYTFTNGWQRADLEILDFSDPVNPYLVGQWAHPCRKNGIAAHNSILAVYSFQNESINFFDITDPENPDWLWAHGYGFQMERNFNAVAVSDTFAIGCFTGSFLDNTCIACYRMTDPQNMEKVSELILGDDFLYSIVLDGTIAYVGSSEHLFIIDVSDLAEPELLYTVEGLHVMDMVVEGSFLYACANPGVRVYYIEDPSNPVLLGSCELVEIPQAIAKHGDFLYIANGAGGVKIVDVADPTHPNLRSTLLPHYDSYIQAKPMMYNNHLVIADLCWNELLSYDLQNPVFPTLVESFPWNSTGEELAATGPYLITADNALGFSILEIQSNSLAEHIPPVTNPFQLSNHPNPFNPSTEISFQLDSSETQKAVIEIYNTRGQRVNSLEKANLSAGRHSITWSGTDATGAPVASGVYLYRLLINHQKAAVQKCLLLK